MKFDHLVAWLFFLGLSPLIGAQDDVADIKSEKLMVDKDDRQSYFLIQPTADKAPKNGFGVLVVLPGGDGSADFHPFVKRIRKNAVPKDFIVVQPIAVKWSKDQKVVWPTQGLKVEKQKFSTEQFVTNVVNAVQKDQKVDPKRIYCMGWSSSGPAVYSLALMKKTVIKGSYVAMSVYKPDQLPALANAKGRSIYVEHSPQDKICPIRMARSAHSDLVSNGARTKFVQYEGGHGWRGGVYSRINNALKWLEPSKPVRVKGRNLVLNPNLLTGDKSPDHWKKGNTIRGVEYSWVKSAKMKDKSFLQIKKTANRFFPIASWNQKIKYDGKSESIFVSADVKAEDAKKAVLDVVFHDKNGKPISHKWAAYIGSKGKGDPAATHDWKQYSGAVEIPANTKTIAVSLQCYGPGVVSFANVSAKFAD